MKKVAIRIKKFGTGVKNWFLALSGKKKLFVFLLILALIFFILYLVKGSGKPTYITAQAVKGDITETVTETGIISTSNRVDVFSPSKGIVRTVSVKNGDMVVADQELFTVESSATLEEQQTAYSAYLAAKATLDDAQANVYSLRASMFDDWDTYYKLATGDLYENSDGTPKHDQRTLPEFHIAQDSWLAAEKQYKEQQTAVAQAQAKTTATWLAYQATQNATIKAPMSGKIANLAVTIGSSVGVESTTQPQPVLVLTTVTTTEVIVPLTETDITKIQEGQEVRLDASATDEMYKGVVRRVDSVGTIESGVMRYNVYIEITDSNDALRPGMNIDATITTQKVTGVLTVPNSAVKPYQGGRAVRVVSGKGDMEYIPVQIGIKGEQFTHIISGISEGQEVITSLSNGQIKRTGFFGN